MCKVWFIIGIVLLLNACSSPENVQDKDTTADSMFTAIAHINIVPLLVVPPNENPTVDARYSTTPEYFISPEGTDAGYWFAKDGKFFLRISDKVFGPYEGPEQGGVIWAGTHFYTVSEAKSWSEQTGAAQYVVLFDGVEGNRYEDAPDIILSPDGTQYAYRARRDGISYLVWNGTESSGHSGHSAQIVFSSDSKHLAYAVEDNGTWHAVYDGRLVEGYPLSQKNWNLQFLSDGRLYFIASIEGKEVIIVDGKETGERYDRILELQFTPDGEAMYSAIREDEVFFVNKGIQTTIPRGDLMYRYSSPDGAHYALVITVKTTETYVVIDGTTYGPYQDVDNAVFSPKGDFVYSALIDYKQYLMIAGRKSSGGYNGHIKDLTFDASGKRFAYIVSQDFGYPPYSKEVAVIDGVESEPFTMISSVTFLRDGTSFFSAGITTPYTGEEKEYAVYNNTKTTGYDLINWGETLGNNDSIGYAGINKDPLGNYYSEVVVDNQVISTVSAYVADMKVLDQGRHYTYITREGNKQQIYVDGRLQKECENIRDLTISSDERYLAYMCETNHRWQFVINNQTSETFDTYQFIQSSENGISFVAVRDNIIYRGTAVDN